MTTFSMKRITTAAVFTLMAAAIHAEPKSPNIDAVCAKNPVECKQIQARVAAQCAESPATCNKGKAHMEQKLGELKKECDANPTACAEKRKKFYDDMEQHKEHMH
jgi:hypothetical protein